MMKEHKHNLNHFLWSHGLFFSYYLYLFVVYVLCIETSILLSLEQHSYERFFSCNGVGRNAANDSRFGSAKKATFANRTDNRRVGKSYVVFSDEK